MAGPALLLMDYGAPGTDDEVRPFIASLLSDPSILPLPPGLRQGLAHYIALRRAPKVTERYRAIGGSPLPAAMETLAEELRSRFPEPFIVRVACCHARPRIAAVLDELEQAGVGRVVGIPLFPQRSYTTSDLCRRELMEGAARRRMSATVCADFATRTGFVRALAAGVEPLLRPGSRVLMVAHGLPRRLERAGDPYPGRVRETAEALAAKLPADTPWSLAFQSRLGPAEWTGPYLEDELARVAAEGVEDLVLVPLSFVCENLETRWDLDKVATELATELGVARVARAPAPASQPAFQEMLEDHARTAVRAAGWCPLGSPPPSPAASRRPLPSRGGVTADE